MSAWQPRLLGPRAAAHPSRVGVQLATTAATAVVIAMLSLVLDWRLLVPIGLGLPVAVLGTLGDGAGRQAVRAVPRGWTTVVHRPAWIAGTWAGMALLASVRLLSGERSVYDAAAGSASADILLELIAYGCASLTIAAAIHAGWQFRVPWLARLPVIFAFLASVSVLWSILPLFSIVRAVQFVILALFTAYSAQRAANEPGWLDAVLPRILRWWVLATVALGAYGVANGGLNLSRFTWAGTHPNTAAALLAAGALALALSPQRQRLSWPLPWWSVLPVLAVLAYHSGSRANVGAAIAALAAGGVVWALRDSRIGALGISSGVMVVALMLQFAWDDVVEFVMRGQESDTVLGLNGRTELWGWVLDNPAGSEVYGVGIGAARGNLPATWAGNAHSAWIDLLQGLGVLGLAVMGALVLACLLMVVYRRSPQAAWMITLPAVGSITAPVLSEPGWGIVLLCLGIVVISGTSARPVET